MAIAFVLANGESANTTEAFDCTGANFLHVGIMRRSGTTMSITYNGVSMTQIAINTGHNVGANDDVFSFGLMNPTTGSNNIVITTNGTIVRWSCACYSGVNALGVENATTHSSAASAPQSVTVTPTNNDWIIGSTWENGNFIADANTTRRTTDSNNFAVFDSNATKSSAYAIGYSNSSPGDLIGFGLVESTASTANGNFLTFM